MELANVKAGDTLILEYRQIDQKVVTVGRVTKTQILIGRSYYRKQDGYSVGGSVWHRSHVRLPKNDQEIADIKNDMLRLKLARWISNKCDYDHTKNLSLTALRCLHQVVKKVCGDEEK